MKTLKDLEELGLAYNGKVTCLPDKLRQEAIKHVKKLSLPKQKRENPPFYYTANKPTIEFMVSWIKHFFNLSESDLK